MKSEIFGGRWDFSLEKAEVSAKLGNFGVFLAEKCFLLYTSCGKLGILGEIMERYGFWRVLEWKWVI